MKRILSILFCLLAIPILSCGEEQLHIYSLKDDDKSWKAEYQSVRGETVKVDIDMAIPDVQNFPCVEAKFIGPSSILPKTKEQYQLEQDDFEFSNGPTIFDYRTPTRKMMQKMKKSAQRNKTYRAETERTRWLYLPFGSFDEDQPYAVNNETTVRMMSHDVDHILKTYFPDKNIVMIPHYVTAQIDPGIYIYDEGTERYEKTEDCPEHDGYLCVWYDQLIEGIPYLGVIYDGYFPEYREYEVTGGTLGGDAWTVGLSHLGSEQSFWRFGCSLLEVSNIIQYDVPLVSLQTIINSAEKYIVSGQLRSVDSLRLGYVAWLKKGGGFILMPTWCIEGRVYPSADAEDQYIPNGLEEIPNSESYMHLYINAQTGEVINPENKNVNRNYDVPAIITWK